jgi:hypothetical protein
MLSVFCAASLAAATLAIIVGVLALPTTTELMTETTGAGKAVRSIAYFLEAIAWIMLAWVAKQLFG